MDSKEKERIILQEYNKAYQRLMACDNDRDFLFWQRQKDALFEDLMRNKYGIKKKT